MGSSRWSDDAYADRAKSRAASHTPTFDYDHKVRTGAAPRKVHASLDPKDVKMREARDSDAHPETLAIAVLFDVTGSMKEIPQVLQKKLAGLMNLLIAKGYAAHPQILFGAIGDAYVDNYPLQVGQFESGIEMEDNLTNILLEGGGGGQNTETYELGLYFLANHTSLDCFEQRGVKGYVFTIGDERFYPTVNASQVKTLIGDTLQQSPTTESVVRQLEERYHVFHIVAMQGSAARAHDVIPAWKALLGERVLQLEDADNVAELIALTIGLTEGCIDVDTGADHLRAAGADAKTIKTVTSALVPLAAAGGALARPGTATGLPEIAASGGVSRL